MPTLASLERQFGYPTPLPTVMTPIPERVSHHFCLFTDSRLVFHWHVFPFISLRRSTLSLLPWLQIGLCVLLLSQVPRSYHKLCSFLDRNQNFNTVHAPDSLGTDQQPYTWPSSHAKLPFLPRLAQSVRGTKAICVTWKLESCLHSTMMQLWWICSLFSKPHWFPATGYSVHFTSLFSHPHSYKPVMLMAINALFSKTDGRWWSCRELSWQWWRGTSNNIWDHFQRHLSDWSRNRRQPITMHSQEVYARSFSLKQHEGRNTDA